MPRLAANLSFLFTDLPFLDRFAAARAQGFEAVEFMFPYAWPAAEVAAAAQAARVAVVLHNLPPGDWDAGERGLAALPGRAAAFDASVELALEYALALGVPRLHCLAGCAPPDAHPVYVASLRRAARRLHAHGIDLLIEPINQHDMPGYFLHSPQQAAAIVGGLDEPNVHLQADLYHWQRILGAVEPTLRALLPLVRHVQIADHPGRHEPGTGSIDYRHLLALLDQLGYDGWVGCEYRPLGDTVAGLAWRSALLDPKQ